MQQTKKKKNHSLIIKKCHVCGYTNQSEQEPQRCGKCNKAFLPSDYFGKIHRARSRAYQDLFEDSSQLDAKRLVKGLNVIW